MRGHADAATLAAFREELLSHRKAAQVSAHLAACPRCAALDAQLAEVTVLLTHAAAPPMPDTVTARIEMALAAEAAARGPAPVTAPAGTAAPGTAGRNGTRGAAGQDAARGAGGRRPGWAGRGWSRPGLRIATVAAAVAVIAGGGYTVAQLLSAGPTVHGATASGAEAPASRAKSSLPRMSSGGIRSAPGNTAAGAATGPVRVVSSGTNYQPAQLAAQASTLLKDLGPNTHSATHPGPTLATPNGYTTLFPDLQACAAHVAGTQHALLVDVAHYRGHPAAIILLPAPPGGGHPRAVVVAPGCTATTSHVLATTPLPART